MPNLYAYMKLLLVLLSIMTFTVETKNSVSMDGVWPYDIGVNYSCSYQKGTVRANDMATLSLSGLENIQLESIQIYMRSNMSGGAGVITMTADGESLYAQSGTYMEWFGAYDNTTYQPIGWTGKKVLNEGSLVIQVAGTENSLYIEKYEIAYRMPAPQAYSVTLMTEGVAHVLTESAPESGVVLPEQADKDGLCFAGWATEEVRLTDNEPYILPAGMLYNPTKNTTLWAVWSNVKEPTWEKQADVESGYYVLSLYEWTLTGTVNNGVIPMINTGEMVYTNDLYYIDFNAADKTCTIRNYAADSYIGFNDARTALRAKESAWQYRVLPDSTWLFIAKETENKTWMLYQHEMYEEAWLGSYILGDSPKNVWELYQLPDPKIERYWTSWPGADAVEEVKCSELNMKREWIIPFGIYDLIIKDGKKELRLKE